MNETILNQIDTIFLTNPAFGQKQLDVSMRMVEMPIFVRQANFFDSPFFTVCMLLLFVLYCILLAHSRTHILTGVGEFFKRNIRDSFFKKPQIDTFSKTFFFCLSMLGIAFFLYQLLILYYDPFLSPWLIGVFFLSFTVYFLLRMLLLCLMGFIFKMSDPAVLYIKDIFFVFSCSGILFFPLMLISLYTRLFAMDVWLIMALSVVSFSLLSVLIKLFQIFCRNYLSLFYLLLYLCTLNFLPILLVLKVIFNNYLSV